MARPRKNPIETDVTNDEMMSLIDGAEGVEVAEATEGVSDFEESVNAPVKAPSSAPVQAVKEVEMTPPKHVEKITYAADDLIPCRSLMAGFMNMKGGKTGNVYKWPDAGHVEYVEYQDLKYGLSGPYIKEPLIIIEDEQLLETREWRAVKEMYDNIYSLKDLGAILSLPVGQMEAAVKKLPSGAKTSLGVVARTRMENGTLDSVKKIKKLDELLGTDLSFLMN